MTTTVAKSQLIEMAKEELAQAPSVAQAAEIFKVPASNYYDQDLNALFGRLQHFHTIECPDGTAE